MPKDTAKQLVKAKERLDTLIANARDQMLNPITIAEALRKIAGGEANIDEIESIRKASYHWCAEICQLLFHKKLSLNRSYWGRLFTHHIPPESLEILASENSDGRGVVEAYVYARLQQTVVSLQSIRNGLLTAPPGGFSVGAFLAAFDDQKLKRSVDKAYESMRFSTRSPRA